MALQFLCVLCPNRQWYNNIKREILYAPHETVIFQKTTFFVAAFSFASCLRSVSHSSNFEIEMKVINEQTGRLTKWNSSVYGKQNKKNPLFYLWLMITLIECSERFYGLQFVVMSNEMSISVMNIHHFFSHLLLFSLHQNKQTWPKPKKIIRDLSKRKKC